jgi:hypothetical protein
VSAFTLMGTDDSRQVLTVALSDFAASLSARKDFTQGVQFIDTVKASFGGIVDLESQRRDMYHNWAVSLIDANTLTDADALLSQPATHTVLGDPDWLDLSIAVVERKAMAESGATGNAAAASIVADGLKKLGRQPPLLQNYEAYVHNAFAELYNLHKLPEARAIAEQGLAVYPDSRIFQQDLDLLRKQPRA